MSKKPKIKVPIDKMEVLKRDMRALREEFLVRMALKEMADSFRQFGRNGCWGTCVECPRDEEGHTYPEFCKHFGIRYDHQLTVDQLATHWNARFPKETP